MHKITEAQRKALKLIAQYPGRVVAWQRGPRVNGYLKINGNVELGISRSGLVEEVSTGIALSTHVENGETITSYLNTWEITDAGRKAIGFGQPEKTTPILVMDVETSPKARQFYSPEIKRTEKSGMDSLRDMLKLY